MASIMGITCVRCNREINYFPHLKAHFFVVCSIRRALKEETIEDKIVYDINQDFSIFKKFKR